MTDLRNFGGRKYRTYKGGDLKNALVTYKIDGVRAIYINGVPQSRAGKPLYNLPPMPDGQYEVFTGSFKGTITAVRTLIREQVQPDHLYSLDPVDHRLIAHRSPLVTESDIRGMMSQAAELGYEGLVIFTNKFMFKVKPVDTYDVVVRQVIPGEGKHAGRMGALVTDMGNVGTGFTDSTRELFTPEYIVGKIIEVECMELTPDGKFRHPRFLRLREDKGYTE